MGGTAATVKDFAQLIGTEWDDKGRRIQIVAIPDGLDDGHGGPVFSAITVANPQPSKIGRTAEPFPELRKRVSGSSGEVKER